MTSTQSSSTSPRSSSSRPSRPSSGSGGANPRSSGGSNGSNPRSASGSGSHAGAPSSSRGRRSARRHPGTGRPAAAPNTGYNGTGNAVRPTAPRPVVRTASPGLITSDTTFAELGLSAAVVKVLAAEGIISPTPIQAASIPDALAGRDVLGRAHTGSGKTLAFGLPLLTRLAAGPVENGRIGQPRGLILLPTRELAQQVGVALYPLAQALGLTTVTVVGGMSISNQIQQLRRRTDLVIATPGRLIDLLDRRSVSLESVEMVVLDEADHMADLGFLPAVTRLLNATPDSRQCLLYSATLDRGVDRLVKRYLSNPAEHRMDTTNMPSAAIDHQVFRVSHNDKTSVAAEIAGQGQRTLFFVRTKHGADRLARQLRNTGVAATALHGNLNQNQRRRALDSFTEGSSTTLVATDVAARGLHVDGLDLVVHFDPPTDPKVYAHRSGRTARAGASGTVLTFVEPDQHRELTKMHAAAGIEASTFGVAPGHPAIRQVTQPA